MGTHFNRKYPEYVASCRDPTEPSTSTAADLRWRSVATRTTAVDLRWRSIATRTISISYTFSKPPATHIKIIHTLELHPIQYRMPFHNCEHPCDVYEYCQIPHTTQPLGRICPRIDLEYLDSFAAGSPPCMFRIRPVWEQRQLPLQCRFLLQKKHKIAGTKSKKSILSMTTNLTRTRFSEMRYRPRDTRWTLQRRPLEPFLRPPISTLADIALGQIKRLQHLVSNDACQTQI